MHSACSQYTVSMQSVCSQYAVSMQSVCSQHAVSMQSVCSQYAVSVQSVCSQYAVSMQSVHTHYTIQPARSHLCLHMAAYSSAHMPLEKPRGHSALSHLSTHSPLSACVVSFGLRVRPEAFQQGAQSVALEMRMTLHHTHCSAHCSINTT